MDPLQKLPDQTPLEQTSKTNLEQAQSGIAANQDIIAGSPQLPPKPPSVRPRLTSLLILIIVLATLSVGIYYAFLKKDPPPPPTPPAPKPTTITNQIKLDDDLLALTYGTDYSILYADGHYLINVTKSPKRVVYDGSEVYKGEDIGSVWLSPNGQHWAIQTNRQERRSARDDNTKIVQDTLVDVATFTVDSEKLKDQDRATLRGITNSKQLIWTQKTGKETPSQYGEALPEEDLFIGDAKKFTSQYGIVSVGLSPAEKNWFALTKSPNTKELLDFYINADRKDPLDARILKDVSIDDSGSYIIALCQNPSDYPGSTAIGKDCQVGVNGKTRTTIAGNVYLAISYGQNSESYAGIDRDLGQEFLRNQRTDLIVEQRKDLQEDPKTTLGVYVNEDGTKMATTSTRTIEELSSDGKTKTKKIRTNLSINHSLTDNNIATQSFFDFGSGEYKDTLFIYTLPAEVEKKIKIE
jgi:hypothetical protein